MAADFNATKIPGDDTNKVSTRVGTTGTVVGQRRLLGDAGAAAAGNGSWHRSNGLWKTFLAYPTDFLASTGVGAALDIKIEACMELPAGAARDTDPFVVVLATLNQSTPNFSTEEPWRYVRARVVNAGGGTVQVGLIEQGQL